MPRQPRRVQNPQEDTSEYWIQRLVSVMNSPRAECLKMKQGAVDPRALVLFVKRLQTFRTIALKVNSDDEPVELEKMEKSINRFLSRYKAHPCLTWMHLPHGWGFWEADWMPDRSVSHSAMELRLVLAAMDIAETRRLSALRQCVECRRWLFARFKHQRFCSQRCKDGFHKFNEADKKRRRDWARANYQTRKRLEAGSIAGANLKRRKAK